MLHMSVNSAEFADRIGVQRSAVSHILNGRNNPSAVVLEKMLKAYPNLNARWLITGEDTMLVSQDSMSRPTSESLFSGAASDPVAPEEHLSGQPAAVPVSQLPPPLPPGIAQNGNIDQIVVFYTDNTFRAFSPR